MDTIQILTLDLPIKSHRITSDKNKFKEVLANKAKKYLTHNGNYFTNGLLYPETLEVLEWKNGLKHGSNMGDELVFTTRVKGCFRLYQIGKKYIGTISSIDSNVIRINHEYIFDICVPITKANVAMKVEDSVQDDEEEDPNEDIKQQLLNNNPMYPYMAENLSPEMFRVGQSVEFIVLNLSSIFNKNNIVVLGFITQPINNFTKVYSINNLQHSMDTINKMVDTPDVNIHLTFQNMLPSYYFDQDKRYMVNGNFEGFDNVNAPVDKYNCCYFFNQLNINNPHQFESLQKGSALLTNYKLENAINLQEINTITKKFANVNLFYDWEQEMLWVVGSYFKG